LIGLLNAALEAYVTDTARKRIKGFFARHPVSRRLDMAGQSCRQIPDMDPYHFVSFPKDANAYDQQRDCKLRNCVIEAIAWYVQVLKSPDEPRNGKRTALRFIATSWATSISRFTPASRRIAVATALTCASMAGKKTCTSRGIRSG
jgi:S1/P1 Nuclease.